jgi:hypothetical protein
MEPERLEIEQASGNYDGEHKLLCVTYRGYVTADVTTQVYAWIRRLIEAHGLKDVHGSVFDFREVTNFVVGNLTATQSNSYHLNNKYDLSNHPVALLVNTIYQRAMVKATLNVTPQQERKQLVYSLEGAFAFIAEWHAQSAQSQCNP